MNILRWLLLIVFVISFGTLFSQVYIGATFGAEVFRAKEANDQYFRVGTTSFNNKNLFYGFSIEKVFSKKYSLFVNSRYSKKEVSAIDTWKRRINADPIKTLHFNYYSTDLSLKYYISKLWFTRLGPTLSFVSSPYRHNYYTEGRLNIGNEEGIELGVIITTGLTYKNVSLELGYNRGITRKNVINEDAYFLKALDSFMISFNYRVQIFKSKEKDKKEIQPIRVRA